MTNTNKRIEPEVSIPDGEAGATGGGEAGAAGAEVSLEELVPGLEDEIARHEGSEAERLAARIAELEAERDDLRDKWTRALAEAENVRRRAERDKADAQTYGGTRLARDMLSVHDNLDRALQTADDDLRARAAAFIEGVELTQRELLNAFAKHKIEKVTPAKGEKFDPNRHQAMFEAPVPGAEPGTVIEAMQDGFVIAGRLLRPALVGVAKAAPEASAPDQEHPASGPEDTGKEDGQRSGG